MTRLSETILPNNILTDSNTQTVTNKTLVGNTNVLGVNVDLDYATFALPTASDELLGQTTYQQRVGHAILNAGTVGLRGLTSGKELVYSNAQGLFSTPTSYDFPTLLEDIRSKFVHTEFDNIEIEIRCVPYYNEYIIPAIQFYDQSSTLITADYDMHHATQMMYGPTPTGYIGNQVYSNLSYLRLSQFDAVNDSYTSNSPARFPFEVHTNIIIQGVRRGQTPNYVNFVSAVTQSGYGTNLGSTQVTTTLARVVNEQSRRLGGFKFVNAYGSLETNRFRSPSVSVFIHRRPRVFFNDYTTTGL